MNLFEKELSKESIKTEIIAVTWRFIESVHRIISRERTLYKLFGWIKVSPVVIYYSKGKFYADGI